MIVLFILFSASLFGLISIPIAITLKITFAINLCIFFALIAKVISKRHFNPFLIITFIFFYSFFFIAPLVQLSFNQFKMLNGLGLRTETACFANILIGSFYLLLFIILNYKLKTFNHTLVKKDIHHTNVVKTVNYLVIISLIVTVFCFPYVVKSFTGAESFNFAEEKSFSLIIKKYFMIIPFVIFLKVVELKKYIPSIKYYAILILLFSLSTLLKNPITEKRNAIGPIFLTIILIFLNKKIRTNINFLFFVLGVFLIMFPLSSLVTHSLGDSASRLGRISSLGDLSDIFSIIVSHFLELHYDAWNTIITTVMYVDNKGFSFGKLLLGALFFFIPRSLWLSKPNGTGQTLVENYVARYGSDFSNISSPFVSEGYINFGIVGVILFAFILAWYFKYLLESMRLGINYNRCIYFSFYLFFLYRGDLMNSIAYYFGFLAACLSVDKAVLFINKNVFYR